MRRTVADFLKDAGQELKAAGVDDPIGDARRIMLEVKGGAGIAAISQDVLDPVEEAAFLQSLALRAERVPMSHILGHRDFMNATFKVTSDVLDPRPETEILICEALAKPFKRFLDLGTGSGCIAISLALEVKSATGVATDVSEAALDIAQENATNLYVKDRLLFAKGHWFAPLSGLIFDLIVSNPPYISKTEMAALPPELAYEPALALTDGADGLTAYRQIIAQAPDFLEPAGRCMVEIGATQAAAVTAIFHAAGFQNVKTIQDLDGRDRVVSGQKAG